MLWGRGKRARSAGGAYIRCISAGALALTLGRRPRGRRAAGRRRCRNGGGAVGVGLLPHQWQRLGKQAQLRPQPWSHHLHQHRHQLQCSSSSSSHTQFGRQAGSRSARETVHIVYCMLTRSFENEVKRYIGNVSAVYRQHIGVSGAIHRRYMELDIVRSDIVRSSSARSYLQHSHHGLHL